jgi:hypothetical protein
MVLEGNCQSVQVGTDRLQQQRNISAFIEKSVGAVALAYFPEVLIGVIRVNDDG